MNSVIISNKLWISFFKNMRKHKVCFIAIYLESIANIPPVFFIKLNYNTKSESI